MIEDQILKILFPNEAVPVDRIDVLPAIRSHIAAIIDLATSKPIAPPPESSEKRIAPPEFSQAAILRIVELREQPNQQGRRRTWAEVATELGMGLSPGAVRHRYDKWKAREKQKALSHEIYEPDAVETAQEEAATLPTEPTRDTLTQYKQKLSSLDATILSMADRGALNQEICIAISRTFSRNFNTGQIAERIQTLREGRA
jgi:hypothetical protein